MDDKTGNREGKLMYDILCEKLNPRNGVVQPKSSNNEEAIYFDIRWKGDFHFIVVGWIYFGWYYVMRNNQAISSFYHFGKIEDRVFSSMQHIIDDIESGKYKNKKTEREKIRKIVEERKLTSFMNNTKWKELTDSIINEIRDIPIKYKMIFDEYEPDIYWTLDADEHFAHMNKSAIEWFKIGSEYKKVVAKGLLIEPKVSISDKRKEIENILHRFNIFYEYDEENKCFTIFGYR